MILPQRFLCGPHKCGQLSDIFIQLLPFQVLCVKLLNQISVFSEIDAVHIFLQGKTFCRNLHSDPDVSSRELIAQVLLILLSIASIQQGFHRKFRFFL